MLQLDQTTWSKEWPDFCWLQNTWMYTIHILHLRLVILTILWDELDSLSRGYNLQGWLKRRSCGCTDKCILRLTLKSSRSTSLSKMRYKILSPRVSWETSQKRSWKSPSNGSHAYSEIYPKKVCPPRLISKCAHPKFVSLCCWETCSDWPKLHVLLNNWKVATMTWAWSDRTLEMSHNFVNTSRASNGALIKPLEVIRQVK